MDNMTEVPDLLAPDGRRVWIHKYPNGHWAAWTKTSGKCYGGTKEQALRALREYVWYLERGTQ